jgi:hypothetical protein
MIRAVGRLTLYVGHRVDAVSSAAERAGTGGGFHLSLPGESIVDTARHVLPR